MDERRIRCHINVPNIMRIALFLQSVSFIADLNTVAVTGRRGGCRLPMRQSLGAQESEEISGLYYQPCCRIHRCCG